MIDRREPNGSSTESAGTVNTSGDLRPSQAPGPADLDGAVGAGDLTIRIGSRSDLP